MNTIQSLKELYVKLGGSLTDTYATIASGIPVSDYTVIPDMIKALYAIYDGDLTEVYPEISDVAVSDYSTTPKAIEALAEVATKGITVNESYDISEGKLNSATFTLNQGFTEYIPDGVTILGGKAFQYNTLITNVEMPNSVLTIENGNIYGPVGYGCFYECINLTNIKLSENLTSIGDFAFRGCSSLTSITIPDSVTSIGNSAFGGCIGLTSITIPDSVTSIGNSAFGVCIGLTSITIPDSVTSIGSSVFNGCTSLTDIYYTGTQAEWEAITGISGAGIPEGATIHYEYTPE